MVGGHRPSARFRVIGPTYEIGEPPLLRFIEQRCATSSERQIASPGTGGPGPRRHTVRQATACRRPYHDPDEAQLYFDPTYVLITT
jgi:hypothetical protein